MKLANLPFLFLATSLAILQVSAVPLHFVVVSSKPVADAEAPAAHLRWGLAAAHAQPAIAPGNYNTSVRVQTVQMKAAVAMRKGGCMRMKSIQLSNWIREKMGLPLIANPRISANAANAAVPGDAHVVHPTITPIGSIMIEGVPDDMRHRHIPHHLARPKTFTGRLHRALITLGPWEGRLVAFVLGCGIGSLLRMIYVLVVVSFRSLGRSNEDTLEEDIIFEAVEGIPPPSYTAEKVADRVDEKQEVGSL